jgi:hypothetical protein
VTVIRRPYSQVGTQTIELVVMDFETHLRSLIDSTAALISGWAAT